LDIWFKTKIQIAVDLLRLSLAWVEPEAIVFDSWYMAKEILDFINSRGLTWVSKTKSNRLILVDEKWVSLKLYATHLSKKVSPVLTKW